jgi:hypothetical protein
MRETTSQEMTMSARPGRRRAGARTLAALLLAIAAALLCGATAQAAPEDEFGIVPGSFAVETTTTQAGAHPDVRVRYRLNPDDATPQPGSIDTLQTTVVDLPTGLAGDPSATPRCKAHQWPRCPVETQVGVMRLATSVAQGSGFYTEFSVPVYNLEPAHGAAAEFGFIASNLQIRLVVTVREGDLGLRTVVDTAPSLSQTLWTDLTLWGDPNSPANDAMRGRSCTRSVTATVGTWGCTNPDGMPATGERKPFMRNPSTCEGPLTARLAVDSYQDEDVWRHAETTVAATTGCEHLVFSATGRATVDDAAPGAPSGLTVELDVPQANDPEGLVTPAVKRVAVTLPEGTVVSPGGADKLQSCTDEQFDAGTFAQETCPLAAKVGDVEIVSPLLSEPLRGPVYVGSQQPGRLLRLMVVARAQGVVLKLNGKLDLDPVTGRVTTVFDDQPKLPFETLRMTFKGGPRAVLANPRTCGPATTTFAITPWGGGAESVSTSTQQIAGGAGCPAGFAPGFSAGSTATVAGQPTGFVVRFARSDLDDPLGGIDVTLPPGVSPKIAGVPLCAEAQAAAGTCGEESRVGSARTTAGPGSQPLGLPGRVYVGGPYKGAPYSLSIVVPAIAGPLDLGLVVVRAAVHVDRTSAQVRVVSDPLPTILQGIPLQIRSVEVAIDRPGFLNNPTSCSPKAVAATIASSGGATASRSARFQVGGCAALPFSPRLALRVGGRGQVAKGRRLALRATLTQPGGQAAMRVVRLVLPRTINARMDVIGRACTFEQFQADACEAARVGTSAAVSPLLNSPLRGSVYLVRSPERRLPDLVARLRGEVAIDLVGRVVITRSLQLTTTFDTIPDVPLSRFSLTLPIGNTPISTAESLCTKAGKRATVRQSLRAQSGRLIQRKAKLAIAGCAKKQAKPAKKAKR